MTMLLCIIPTMVFASEPPNYTTNSEESNNTYFTINDEFEEKVRRAGRVIAEEKGLLIDADTFAQYQSMYANKNISEAEKSTLHKEIRDNSVTLNDIYQRFPDLAVEAKNIDGLDHSYVEPILEKDSSTPKFGDYRSKIYYSYSERTKTDSVKSSTYSGLQNLAISIVAIGLKPAQSILISVLQTAIGSYSWTSCSDYHLTTLQEKCLSGKWGEVYTSGGLLCETDWRGYCYASRTDKYAIATAVTWRGNICISNTTNAVHVSYAYDNKYLNATYIKKRTLELYQQAYDETYTILYGVLPGYVEYNWNDDYIWTVSTNNPFS